MASPVATSHFNLLYLTDHSEIYCFFSMCRFLASPSYVFYTICKVFGVGYIELFSVSLSVRLIEY